MSLTKSRPKNISHSQVIEKEEGTSLKGTLFEFRTVRGRLSKVKC